MRQLPLAQSHTSGRWERDIAGNRMWVSSAPPLTIAPEVLPGAGAGASRSEGGGGPPPPPPPPPPDAYLGAASILSCAAKVLVYEA